jgi:4-azaleucine resistance transporter AzlC
MPMSRAEPSREHASGGAAPHGDGSRADAARGDAAIRRAIHRQAASIVAAVAPFGIVFGATAATAGFTLLQAIGYSTLIFGGSSQFAAAEILGDGGSVAAAAIAGLLLNVRSLAFGVIMAPALTGALWQRAAMAHLMIDESTAVGVAQVERRWQRYGFLVAGVSVLIVWNLTTIAGHLLFSDAGDLIETLGLDAAGPAAFLALLWPRLRDRPQLRTAIAGAAIAVVLVPLTPAGVPILAAMIGVLASGLVRSPGRGIAPPSSAALDPASGATASPADESGDGDE